MAILPDAQARLRKEVTDARKANGDLDLEALMALPYLDAICKETLRLYVPFFLPLCYSTHTSYLLVIHLRISSIAR